MDLKKKTIVCLCGDRHLIRVLTLFLSVSFLMDLCMNNEGRPRSDKLCTLADFTAAGVFGRQQQLEWDVYNVTMLSWTRFHGGKYRIRREKPEFLLSKCNCFFKEPGFAWMRHQQWSWNLQSSAFVPRNCTDAEL